jgi:3-phenylpropionate/trans-cinnamate dioxygenase ferredoxin reductase subunit
MAIPTFVIVGAGMAGARAAATLREDGFDGRVVLLGDDPAPPYDRVPLSKQRLRGEPGGHTLFVHDDRYYADRNIELRLETRVDALDVKQREVVTASGEHFRYDALLLAQGSAARRLRIPGADLDGVHYLRTLADCDRLRTAIAAANRVAVIGAGWVGCEVAASARELGAHVVVVDVEELPLQRSLGAQMGRFYRDLHADHGVEMHLGIGVERLRGGTAVNEVVLANGHRFAADVVVAGVGAHPRDELAAAAGIRVDDGVVTDQTLATSVAGVFAAGDIANSWRPSLGRRLRLEHWSAALRQGPVAARNMLGRSLTYDPVPFFFSDQYDVWMEYSGSAIHSDELVVRGDVGRREFIAFWLRQGKVVAGMNVNIRGVVDTIAALIEAGSPIDPTALADPAIDLPSLVPASA